MAIQLDLPALLETPVRDPLPEEAVKAILATHPFIPVPNALNLRTISHPPNLAPNLIFRSGALSHLPAASWAQLKDTYNITTIFDLRSADERQHSPSPDIPGIETIWIPSGVDDDIRTSGPGNVHWKIEQFNVPRTDFVENQGKDAYVKLYNIVLETHRRPYKAVFERLRDSEGGVLFHCTGASHLSWPCLLHHLTNPLFVNRGLPRHSPQCKNSRQRPYRCSLCSHSFTR
jgi:hypothetical protein